MAAGLAATHSAGRRTFSMKSVAPVGFPFSFTTAKPRFVPASWLPGIGDACFQSARSCGDTTPYMMTGTT